MSENDKDAAALREIMRATYDQIIDFIMETPVKDLIEEMYALKPQERPAFVREKLMNKEFLSSKGVSVPDDILIQRSSFGDGRPTLVVFKKYLPDGSRDIWENVNITFDQELSGDVPEPTISWQKPLPNSILSVCQALGYSSEDVQKLRSSISTS